MMKLSDKIVQLRKAKGWSQEDLAEKLNVSRQAISRWEGATAQPDAANILQLSKLFGITTDYLLNDAYESDHDVPIKKVQSNAVHQRMILMITLEVMIWLIQFTTTIVLQNTLWGVLSFIPFVAAIGGFEYLYQKRKEKANEKAQADRRNFYKISAWIGLYFPIRFIVRKLSSFYPRPYYAIALEGVVLIVYLMAATLICLQIEKGKK